MQGSETGRVVTIALMGPFDRKWQSHVTGRGHVRKWPWPEVGSAHARLSPRAFFLVVVPWLPDVTKGHLTPSEFPWVCATGSCATPVVVVVNNVGWGVLYDVRVLYLAGLLELYLVTGTSPGYLPLLFSYSVYIGCVVLLLC